MRIKFPDFDPDSGNVKKPWCVEFRPMGLQRTVCENASFQAFTRLMSQALLYYQLDLCIPITKLDENIRKSVMRDAVNEAKFVARKVPDILSQPETVEYCELTTAEFFLGKEGEFFGLLPLVRQYLNLPETNSFTPEYSGSVKTRIDQYLTVIEGKASGKIPTTAAWIRNFIRKHPGYKFDSVVTKEINYDLIRAYEKSWSDSVLGDGVKWFE